MSTEATPTKTIAENNEEDEKERSRIVRLRENKRRSRARQKEYVQQLERRCREYEQAHVQATVEMQAAARKVAEENRLLRALLKKAGYEDSTVVSWLESHGGTEDRTINHSLRRSSESSATAINGSPQGEGLHGHQYANNSRLDTIHLDHTHHYPVLDTSSVSPTSPRTHHLPLLLEPTHHTHHGLHFSESQAQSYTYSTSSSTFTSGASTPTASTVASSPRLTMDSSYNTFFPAISPSPSMQPQFPPASPLMDRPPGESNKPLVYIRLDPTNDLYKLYPMSTIAIMPWLNSNDSSMSDQEALHHHLANLNVSAAGVQCLSPKGSAEQLSFPSPHTYANQYAHAHFSPKQGNVSLEDLARRPSGSWGGM